MEIDYKNHTYDVSLITLSIILLFNAVKITLEILPANI